MRKTNFDIHQTAENAAESAAEIFADPVAYLAGFGIESEIVPEQPITPAAMPAAA